LRRVPADLAAATWANCGPAAIAAALGLDLADVREAVSKRGRFPGYMGVRDIERACKSLEHPIRVSASNPGALAGWPHGVYIAMVNIDGPWRRDPRAQARHRHIVAAAWDEASRVWRVYDANANYWAPEPAWSVLVMTPLARESDREATGAWSFSWRGVVE
jgi:hypothetical protein